MGQVKEEDWGKGAYSMTKDAAGTSSLSQLFF